jgi:hypothetical protein
MANNMTHLITLKTAEGYMVTIEESKEKDSNSVREVAIELAKKFNHQLLSITQIFA